MIPLGAKKKRTETGGTVEEGRRVACCSEQVLEPPSHIQFLEPLFESNDYCISGGTANSQPL